jgi:hypothetical protein
MVLTVNRHAVLDSGQATQRRRRSGTREPDSATGRGATHVGLTKARRLWCSRSRHKRQGPEGRDAHHPGHHDYLEPV